MELFLYYQKQKKTFYLFDIMMAFESKDCSNFPRTCLLEVYHHIE